MSGRALIILLVLLSSLAQPRPAWAKATKRKVTISWRAEPSVPKYELEVSTDPGMDPVINQGNYGGGEATLNLPPGTYYFRVRGVTADVVRGPWADVEGFVVNPAPPEKLAPADGLQFSTLLPAEGIAFRWAQGLLGSKYLIEIKDAQGVTLRRQTEKPQFAWTPEGPGNYRWRVGFETTTREEWGPYAAFSVTLQALPPPKTVTVIKTVTVTKEVPERIPEARQSSWKVIAHAGGFLESYSGQNPDATVSGTGSALNAMGSLELGWDGPKPRAAAWVAQGSLEAEVFRQSAFGIAQTLPRAELRFGVSRDFVKFAFGPFAELSTRSMEVVSLGSSVSNPSAVDVQRLGLGAGIGAVYRLSRPISFSLFGLGREDVGGSADTLGGTVPSAFGYEAGLSTTFETSSGVLLGIRVRGDHESAEWNVAPGQAKFADTLISFDLSFGLRF